MALTQSIRDLADLYVEYCSEWLPPEGSIGRSSDDYLRERGAERRWAEIMQIAISEAAEDVQARGGKVTARGVRMRWRKQVVWATQVAASGDKPIVLPPTIECSLTPGGKRRMRELQQRLVMQDLGTAMARVN